jgi:aspartyl-tRNA(Asn)/glutamyl-tRNA(Gln) amidotransferase subunit A
VGAGAFASSLDQVGPIARSAADAALALAVIAGPDGRDSTAAAEPVDDYPARLAEGDGDAAGLAGLTVGVIREAGGFDLAPDARLCFEQALGTLDGLGVTRVEVSVPGLEAALAAYQVISAAEASANLARFDGVRYGRRAAAGTIDRLYVASRSRGFGPEVRRRVLLGTFALSAGHHDAYYGRARAAAAILSSQLDAALGAADLLVTPTAPSGAFALGERLGDPLAMAGSDVFTVPAALAGLPAVAVPMGCDDRGLPLSLQLIGRRFDEAGVLRLAHAFERRIGWRVEPGFETGETAEEGEAG